MSSERGGDDRVNDSPEDEEDDDDGMPDVPDDTDESNGNSRYSYYYRLNRRVRDNRDDLKRLQEKATRLDERVTDNRALLDRFREKVGSMINKFSDNSIEAAEAIGSKLEEMSDSVNETCNEVDDDDIDEETIEKASVVINGDNRRFLDYVQEKAPELYQRMAGLSVALRDDIVQEKMKLAAANFFDPMAYFGEGRGQISVSSERIEAAAQRNRIDLANAQTRSGQTGQDTRYGAARNGGSRTRQGLNYTIIDELITASSGPQKLTSYLDREIQDAKNGVKYT